MKSILRLVGYLLISFGFGHAYNLDFFSLAYWGWVLMAWAGLALYAQNWDKVE